MIIFLNICLLIMPWVFYPFKDVMNQFRLPQGIFLILTFMGIICFGFFKGNKFYYRNKYLSLLSGWVFFNIFLNFFIPFSFEFKMGEKIIRKVNFWAIEPMMYFTLGLIATYFVLSSFEKEDFVKIAKVLCLSSVFMAIFSMLQYFGFDPLKAMLYQYKALNRVSACLDNPNLVGNYLALISPLFLYFKEKKYWLGYLIILIGIIITKSNFALFCWFVGLITYITVYFRNNKKVLISIAVFLILSSSILLSTGLAKSFMKSSNLMSGRIMCWQKSVPYLRHNPLLGRGLGIYKTWVIETEYKDIGLDGDAVWLNAHNDWLQYSIELGLIGIFLFILVILNSLRNFTFKEKIGYSYFASFIMFLVMMCASFPLEVPSIGILGLISFWAVEKL